MDGARSLLSDRLQQEAPQPSPLPLPQDPQPAVQERVKSPEAAVTHTNAATDVLKPQTAPQVPEGGKSLLLQGLEGTMALLAAKGVEGTKSIYPLAMENLRAFLPYTSEGAKSYLQERTESHNAGPERRENVRPGGEEGGEVRQGHRSNHSPKSQLSNPRHDATLVHAIRELHEEEFGLDAVLLAEGGHVGAHCAVLAVASPFLKSLLLTTTDHPAFISVTGTPLATVQGVVTCLYTGTVPPGASLYQLIEVANLLRMDDLSLVLQQTFLAQGGSLFELARLQGTHNSASPHHSRPEPQHAPPEPHHTHSDPHHTHTDLYHDRSEKRRGSRLDQILYQKLNVNHLAPTNTPDPCPAPPPDPRGGILGELLSKADPMRSMFATGGYPIPDLAALEASANPALKPLNLSKDSKPDPSPSYPHYAAVSQPDLNLGALASLPCNMSGLLAPLTPATLLPSALASLATLGIHHPLAAAKIKSSTSTSNSSSSSRNRHGNRSSSSRSGSRHGSNSRKSSHPPLPLLHSLKGNMTTPDVTKELNDHLKHSPQMTSFTSNFDSLHNNLSALSSSASLQNLANLHNLSNLQNFPALFPFFAPAASETVCRDTHQSSSNPVLDLNLNLHRVSAEHFRLPSPSATAAEDQGALNLSAAAPQCDSPKPIGNDDHCSRVVDNAEGRGGDGGERGVEETSSVQHISMKEDGCHNQSICNLQSTKCESESLSSRLGNSTGNSFFCNSLDSRTLPLLLMSSGANLSGMTHTHGDIPKTVDASVETLPVTKQEPPPLVSLDDDPHDDNGIEVIEEIPGPRCPFQVRKNLYPTGHPMFQQLQMGRKRKGCGECDGCQVVEDCSQCRFCRDKAKFGGPNRLKQVCVYKRCILAEVEPEDAKKRRKMSGKKSRGKCGGCDGCQRTQDCNECYACLHNAAAQPPARRKVCEMRVCEQQQMEEVRAALSVAGEPSPYSTDSLLLAETLSISSGASSPTPDQPSTHNDRMKLMRKMLKKKFAQPYSRVSPSKVRTKYYCGECPGCQTTTPCGHCLYCEDMPKFGGPGRYRQKCVKQLCVYHPRLQALKLSNRSKVTYDEQHISQETLSHLGSTIPSAVAGDSLDMGCRDNLEELESLGDDVDDVTEGEDSNAPLHVGSEMEELRAIKSEPAIKLENVLTPSNILSSSIIPSTIIPSSAVPATVINSPAITSPIMTCVPHTIPLPSVSAEPNSTPAPHVPSDPPTDTEPEVIPICDDSISSSPNNEDSTMSITESKSAIITTTTITTSAIPLTTTTDTTPSATIPTTASMSSASPTIGTIPDTTTTLMSLPQSHPPTSPESPAPAVTPTSSQSPVPPTLIPTPSQSPAPVLTPTPTSSCIVAPSPTPCLSPVPALTPTTQLPAPTLPVPSSSQSPSPTHTPTVSESPDLTNAPTPTQSPTPTHIPEPVQSPATNIPPSSQSPTPAHMPTPSQSPTPVSISTPSQSTTPVHMPASSLSPIPAQMPASSQSPIPAQMPTSSQSPIPAHIPVSTESPAPAQMPTSTEASSPAVSPKSKPKRRPVIREAETENLDELNDADPNDNEDDDDEEDYDDKEDYAALMSDASDIPSPPSTPSPRPRTRGRGSMRGKGRGRGKDDFDDVLIETRRTKAMRRGSRRRKTRFNLEPDDNSGGWLIHSEDVPDFEELLHELDSDGRVIKAVDTSGQREQSTEEVSLPISQAERLSTNMRGVAFDGKGGRGGGRGQWNQNLPTKMVSRSQNTDPDIFEFKDSQDLRRDVIEMRRSGLGIRREGMENKREGVETRRLRMEGVETRRGMEVKRETNEITEEGLDTRREEVETRLEPQEGMSLKHNGPYATLADEELNQGGRDVNENVGGISEAASA
ncbi:hypothetical protein Pmani_027846 [Petrolisthes manimaculis]|uniref:Uncharacterized protein n=1 Tax=Petrolisthes manimaculis TaxID=1843537 RepID=A0AAE1P3B3_9EUCA|nr:hypothetical protein Pmani_027846 [Petrolisthes manimaculis]